MAVEEVFVLVHFVLVVAQLTGIVHSACRVVVGCVVVHLCTVAVYFLAVVAHYVGSAGFAWRNNGSVGLNGSNPQDQGRHCGNDESFHGSVNLKVSNCGIG